MIESINFYFEEIFFYITLHPKWHNYELTKYLNI